MDYEKLQTLVNLKNAGEISKDEFDHEKAKLYAELPSPLKRGQKLGLENTTYYMLQHISLYCTFFIPVFGMAVPVTLWLMNKQEDQNVDRNGRMALNWMLTSLFFTLCGIVLSPIVVGLIFLGITIILSIIFPMMAAFKAKSGRVWRYPLSIDFFPVQEDPLVYHQYPPQQPYPFPPQNPQEPPTYPPAQ